MITLAITSIITLIIGYISASTVLRKSIERKSENILKDAEKASEQIKKDKILQAKEKFIELKSEHEKFINSRNQKISDLETKAKEKDSKLNQRLEESKRKAKELDKKRENLSNQLDIIERKKVELEKVHTRQVKALETISGMSAEDAKEQLVEALKGEAKTEAMSLIQDTIEEAKLTANNEAKKIVIQTIQRVATEHSIENSVSIFNIESDDIKGRIIGREGRNIVKFWVDSDYYDKIYVNKEGIIILKKDNKIECELSNISVLKFKKKSYDVEKYVNRKKFKNLKPLL